MFERFTGDARSAVVGAGVHAEALHHGWIGTEHVLLGLLDDADGRAARLLRERWALDREWARAEVERVVGRGEPDLDADALATLGIDLDAVRERVERRFGAGALSGSRRCRRGSWRGAERPFTPRAKKALELSLREAVAMGDKSIGSEHLLLGLAREGDGVAARILRERGVDHAAVRAALERDKAA
jgi:ATP-dependent Clp protease ATP-binding subunit ClpA